MYYALFWSLIAVILSAQGVFSQMVEAPAPTCEQQVQEQYKHLSTDGLLPPTPAPQWGAQLLAITSQLRVQRNQYELKKNQAEQAEQQWLQTNEQLRQSRQAAPRAAAAPGSPAPTN